MSEEAVRVFISYSWDSNEHKEKVLALSESLRTLGIDCQIDRYHQSPPEGWYQWMMDQIEESDFVLVVCTEKYNLRYRKKEEQGQGLGVAWEGGLIIAELYSGQGINKKYIPVLLSSEGEKNIPQSLQAYTIYRLFSSNDYDLNKQGDYQNLYRHLTKQPAHVPAKLGKPQILLPANGDTSTVGNQGEIIQAKKSEGLPEFTVREENNSLQTLLEEFVVNLLNGRDSKNIKFISGVYQELLEVINPVSEITKYRIDVGLSHFGKYFHRNQEIQNFIDKNFLNIRSGSTSFIEEILTYIPMGYAVFQWNLKSGKEWTIEDLNLLNPRRYNFTGSKNNITGLIYKTGVEEIHVPYHEGIIHIVNKPSLCLGSPYGKLDCQRAICSYLLRGVLLQQHTVENLVKLGLMSDQLKQKLEDQEVFSKHVEFKKYLENVIFSDFRDSTTKDQDIQEIIEQVEEKLLRYLIQPLIEWNFGVDQDGYYGEFCRPIKI